MASKTNHVYTDGFKFGGNVGTESLGIAKKYKLPNLCTVFHAEILAIPKCSTKKLHRNFASKKVRISLESRAALKSLKRIDSKLKLDCHE